MKADIAPVPVTPPQRNLSIAVYLLITGLSAACGLVIEIVAGRMIAPYLGMSLYTWTAVIAVVLAGFSAGHWVGGRIAEKCDGPARRWVALGLFLAGLTAALSLVLLRTLSGPILSLGLSPVPTILILTFALFFMPSFFVGIPSPVLTKLAIDEAPTRIGTLLGAFYAVGALGSIAGTLAAGYIFISYLGSIRTILIVAFLYLAMAAVLLGLDWKRQTERPRPLWSLLPIIASMFVFALTLLWGHSVRSFVENCTRESAYYCIRVIDNTREIGIPSRTLVLDHLGHGTNLRDRPQTFLTPYVEAQDAIVRLRFPERTDLSAFFIGGGAYTLPRGWLARWPHATVTVAEIDPAVTGLARSALWLEEYPGLTIKHLDARHALRDEEKSSHDVIIGDAFHDIGVPQHLTTEEFFSLVKNRLKPSGIYLMNVVDDGARPRLALSVHRTLSEVFPVVELWRPYGQGARQTFVLVAGNDPTTTDTLYSNVDPQSSWHRMEASEIAKLAELTHPLVLTDDFAPVDRLIGAE
jgi:predicted membrane-bound spermidine synthase